MIDRIDGELEYYSLCCTAPPLYNIDTEWSEPKGICMHCRERTTFEVIDPDEDEYVKEQNEQIIKEKYNEEKSL